MQRLVTVLGMVTGLLELRMIMKRNMSFLSTLLILLMSFILVSCSGLAISPNDVKNGSDDGDKGYAWDDGDGDTGQIGTPPTPTVNVVTGQADTPPTPTVKVVTGQTDTPRTPTVKEVAAFRLDVGGEIGRYEFIPAKISLTVDGVTTEYGAQVHGRGNSTWGHPKSSYTIRLDDKAELLGMSRSRHWALVANYEDKSLLRNFVGTYLGEAIGLEATVTGEFVDLWLNGNYWGNYYLMEKIEPEPERVPIDGDTGILFEFDGHVMEGGFGILDPNNWASFGWSRFGTTYYNPETNDTFLPVDIGGKWVTIKEPSKSKLTLEMADFAVRLINDATDALKSHNYKRISEKLDVASFVKWYIVEELTNNTDSSMHSSVYMYYRESDAKLVMGPVWDFDRGMGNCDYWNVENRPDDLYRSGAGWFMDLFMTKEARDILKEEWEGFQPVLDDLTIIIMEKADEIHVSADYNFKRWDILTKRVGANQDWKWATVYDDYVRQLYTYLEERRELMNVFLKGLR